MALGLPPIYHKGQQVKKWTEPGRQEQGKAIEKTECKILNISSFELPTDT